MHRRLADRLVQRHRGVDRGLRGPWRADHFDQRHQIGRIPPMGAERALAMLQPFHDLGDRDDRGVARQDRVGAHMLFDLAEQLLLERQILQHRFDHEIGVAHGRRQIGIRRHAFDRLRIVAEIAQVGADALLHIVQIGREGIGDRHVMAAEREHLRDAVAHEAGADDGDARFGHANTFVRRPGCDAARSGAALNPGPFQIPNSRRSRFCSASLRSAACCTAPGTRSISPPYSRRRRRGCGRYRNPTPRRRGTAAVPQDRTARRAGPSARAPEMRRARPWPCRCPHTSRR